MTIKHKIPILWLCLLCIPLVSAYFNGLPPSSAYREIIVDAPWRIKPNISEIPVLIFIHDAGYPCNNENLAKPYRISNVTISYQGKTIKIVNYNLTVEAEKQYNLYGKGAWYSIIYVDTSGKFLDDTPYSMSGDTELTVKINGFDISCDEICNCWLNQNNIEQVLSVHIATEDLPKFDNWYCGDTHYHTVYTDDPAPAFDWPYRWGELGAPVEAVYEAAKSIGIDWTSANAHSEDLDDYKWSDDTWGIKNVCGRYNGQEGFVCIPGEEISCGWKNCVGGKCPTPWIRGVTHYLAYDFSDWIYGSSITYAQNCGAVIDSVNSQGGIGYVAHPMNSIANWKPWVWDLPHLKYPVSGYEVWNVESKDDEFGKSINAYDSELLWDLTNNPNRRVYIIGGSDAQGMFNTIYGEPENGGSIFGLPRTCCKLDSLNRQSILNALKNGHCFFGNGPALKFTINGKQIGDTVNIVDGENISMNIEWKSTEEFDKVDKTNTTSQIVFICCLKEEEK